MKTRLAVMLLALEIGGATTIGVAPAPSAADDAIAATLKKVVEANLAALNKEDLDAASACIHPKAPLFAATRETSKRIFETHDLIYELQSFRYIGRDADYAVARVTQETRKKAGPAFRDNRVDAMHVFRKDGADWKLWQTVVLEVQFLDEADRPSSGAPPGTSTRPAM